MIHKFLNPLQMIQRTITLDDFEKLCEAENGAIDEAVVYQICDRDSFTVDANKVITALAMKSGKQAYKWTPDMESAFADDNGQRSRENNSYLKNHLFTIIFKDDESVTAKLDEDSGRVFLGVIVKLSTPVGADQKWKHLGFLNGLALTTSEAPTGQLYEDLRGHTLNFAGKELTRALTISDTIVDTLLNPPS